MKHATRLARLIPSALALGACLSLAATDAAAQQCDAVDDDFTGVMNGTQLGTLMGWSTSALAGDAEVQSQSAFLGSSGLTVQAVRNLPNSLSENYRISLEVTADADATIELVCTTSGGMVAGRTAQVAIDVTAGTITSTRPGASPGSLPLLPSNPGTLEFIVDEAGFTRILYNGAILDDAPFVSPTGSCPSADSIRFLVPGGFMVSPALVLDDICVSNFTGSNYCSTNPNSTGVPTEIRARGTGSLVQDDITLEMTSMPNFSFGFFITSQTQGFVMNPAGSQGNLCLGGAIGRYVGPGQIQNSGSTGMIALPITWSNIPQPTMSVSASIGQTWNFQGWHRDSVMGTATSNFSNGVSVPVTL